jgi:hypothetical protein
VSTEQGACSGRAGRTNTLWRTSSRVRVWWPYSGL